MERETVAVWETVSGAVELYRIGGVFCYSGGGCLSVETVAGAVEYMERYLLPGAPRIPVSCFLGNCEHYGCTEGEALAKWERETGNR